MKALWVRVKFLGLQKRNKRKKLTLTSKNIIFLMTLGRDFINYLLLILANISFSLF